MKGLTAWEKSWGVSDWRLHKERKQVGFHVHIKGNVKRWVLYLIVWDITKVLQL